MYWCQECGEPSVNRFVVGIGGSETHLCYLHAADASLLEMPLETIRALAAESGYPINGIAFVLEALCRADRTMYINRKLNRNAITKFALD